MKNKNSTSYLLLLALCLLFHYQSLNAQSSCPVGIGVLAEGTPIEGTSDCTFTVEVEWVKQSANNTSLQLLLLVDGSDEFDDGISCDIQSITTPTGLPQIYTFPNSFTTDCNVEISVEYTARTNQTCGGGNCGSNTLIAVVALPVELAYFNARTERASVLLDWHTLSEENNDYFAIEHSRDGRYFREIGQVKGNGTTSEPMYYQFVDKSPLRGINYYRLKQVDSNRDYEYTTVKVVNYKAADANIQLLPNLVQDELRIVFYNNFLRETPIEVFDILGHLLLTQKLNLGENEMLLDVANWKEGPYFIRIRGEREFILKRFVKLE